MPKNTHRAQNKLCVRFFFFFSQKCYQTTPKWMKTKSHLKHGLKVNKTKPSLKAFVDKIPYMILPFLESRFVQKCRCQSNQNAGAPLEPRKQPILDHYYALEIPVGWMHQNTFWLKNNEADKIDQSTFDFCELKTMNVCRVSNDGTVKFENGLLCTIRMYFTQQYCQVVHVFHPIISHTYHISSSRN